MSRVFLAWGAMMLVIALVGLLFFGYVDPESPALLFGTAGVFFALGLFLALTRFGTNVVAGPHALPEISPPVPLLALAIVLAMLGATVGWWLSLIAAGMAALAIGGLVRELVAQRRALRRAVDEHGPGAAPSQEARE